MILKPSERRSGSELFQTANSPGINLKDIDGEPLKHDQTGRMRPEMEVVRLTNPVFIFRQKCVEMINPASDGE